VWRHLLRYSKKIKSSHPSNYAHPCIKYWGKVMDYYRGCIKLFLSSASFGIVGLVTLIVKQKRGKKNKRTLASTMLLVSGVSMMYHATGHPLIKVIDMALNYSMGIPFMWLSLRDGNPLPILAGTYALRAFSKGNKCMSNEYHLWHIHVPVLMGFTSVVVI
jgi:hypothetical protein